MGGRVRTPYWQDAWMARRRRSSWAPPKWYVVFLEEKIHNRPEISDHFHTHVPEGCAKHTYNTRPFENGSAGRREEGLASLTPCTKNEKNEVKSPFPIPEVWKVAGVKMYIVKWGVKVLFMGGGFSPPTDNMRDRRKKSMKIMAGRRHRNFLKRTQISHELMQA